MCSTCNVTSTCLKQCLITSLKWISDAFQSAQMLCDQYYFASPDLKLTQVNGEFSPPSLPAISKIPKVSPSLDTFYGIS